MGKYYMGIDVGSVSTNIVLMDENIDIHYKRYLRTQGKPIEILKEGIGEIEKDFGKVDILGVGVTGSGRYLANIIVGIIGSFIGGWVGSMLGLGYRVGEFSVMGIIMGIVGACILIFIVQLLTGRRR